MESHESKEPEKKVFVIDRTVYEKIYNDLKKWFKKYGNEKSKLSATAKMALISGAIKTDIPDFIFVGFYVVVPVTDAEGKATEDKILEIGPYQCEILPSCRIKYGNGVCGTCWKEKNVRIENDVGTCSNYIACDSVTNAEIVMPVFKSKGDTEEVVAMLDIDSELKDRFLQEDQDGLQKILDLIYE